ncbi:hypothetical protein J7K70_01380 [bacterium]|nr:hypothetical protein [bacterium]
MPKKKKRKIIDIYPPSSIKKKASQEVFIKKVSGEKQEKAKQERQQGTYPAGQVREEGFSSEWYSRFPPRATEEEKKERKKIFSVRNLMGLGAVLLIIGFYYLGFIVLAKAEIDIKTIKSEIPFSGNILIDSNVAKIDYQKGVIPGTKFIFQKKVEKTIKSTGRGKDERKAKGTVTLYNAYSTSPQILVATTRLATPDNKIYRLDSRIVIPGARIEAGKIVPSKIDVAVTADKPGPEYNIGPCELPDCKFTIVGFKGTSKYKKFYGTSSKPMTGGASASMPMIVADDVKNGEEEVLKEMADEINEEIKKRIPPDITILEEAKSGLKLTKLSKDAEVGDFRESFSITGQGEVIIIGFKKEDLINYIQENIKKDISDNQEFYQDPDIQIKVIQTDFAKGYLKARIESKQKIRSKLSPEAIKDKIKGCSIKELKEALQEFEGIEQMNCRLSPFWIKRVPRDSRKIKVSID